MTNKKSTKKALLSSVLALLLCMSMLIGTTFAWFTDSVESGKNRITAGNLDVELDYWTGSKWDTVHGEDDLFTKELWEPGHTEVVYLRLTNAGTLALKWQLAINIAAEQGSISVETNEGFKLSDFIEFGVVEGINGETDAYAQREDAIDDLNGESKKLNAGYSDNGNMTAGAVEYMAVVVYMPETVGNEANYKKGAPIPTIDLGIKLIATQFTKEEDSFDELYDQGANATVTIEGIDYVYDGTDVILEDASGFTGEDLVVPQGVTVIGAGAFSGHTTIKNVVLPNTVKTIEKQAFQKSSLESIDLPEGLVTIEDQAFNQALNLSSFEIPSTVTSIGWNAFRTVAVNPLVIPANVTSLAEGAFRDLTQVETIIIEGSPEIANFAFRSCKKLQTVIILGEDTTFVGGGQVFTHYDKGEVDEVIDVFVPNETVKTGLLNATAQKDTLNVIVATKEVEGILKAADGTRYVYSVEGLQNLHNVLAVNPGEVSQKVSLVTDLDMTGVEWQPLDKMRVELEGNGHTISNLTVNGDKEWAGRSGLLAYMGGGYIKDLTMENVTSIGSQAGIFAGQSEGGDIINCTIAGTNLVAWNKKSADSITGDGVGAFIGVSVSYGTANEISGTIADGAVVTLLDSPYAWAKTNPYYGGFFTASYETLEPIVNVTNNGTVTSAIQVAPGLLKTEAKQYQIVSKEGLKNLYSVVSANPGEGRGDTITLMADIDMAGEVWTPVDTMWMTIDGNGHTIFNLTCAEGAESGLFSYAGHVTVKNLTLHNVTATGSRAGAFFARAEGGVLENCKLSGNVSISYKKTDKSSNGIGALIGWSVAATLTDVEIVEGTSVILNKGTMTTSGTFLDNYVGAGGTYTGTVTNNGTFIEGISTAEQLIALGATGPTHYQHKTYMLMNDIDLNGAAMRPIGTTYGGTLTFLGNNKTISNVKLTADRFWNSLYSVGLFFASTDSTLTVSDLKVDGVTTDVSAEDVKNFYNNGLDTHAGTIVGYCDGNSTVVLKNVDVANAAILNEYGNAGIFVGYTAGKVLTMTDCDISGSCSVSCEEDANKAGAYAGTVNTAGLTVTITNCTSNGMEPLIGRSYSHGPKVVIDGVDVSTSFAAK